MTTSRYTLCLVLLGVGGASSAASGTWIHFAVMASFVAVSLADSFLEAFKERQINVNVKLPTIVVRHDDIGC